MDKLKKIIFIVSVVSFTFITSISSFAQNRIDYNVNQQQMLQVVYNNIHGTNTSLGYGQWKSNIYCSPAIYLDAGKCYIQWDEITNAPYTKETAYQSAVARYSLTAFNGTYTIEYLPSAIIIKLSTSGQPNFYSGVINPLPTQNVYNYGTIIGQKNVNGPQVPTTFEYTRPYDNTYYSSWFYIFGKPDYWNNCMLKKQELERQGYTVIRYYPSNGTEDLRLYGISGPIK